MWSYGESIRDFSSIIAQTSTPKGVHGSLTFFTYKHPTPLG